MLIPITTITATIHIITTVITIINRISGEDTMDRDNFFLVSLFSHITWVIE